MPKYTPLPIVQLDPRNEEGILRAASRRVYEASGGTLNDFSSGSPIRALLEGQVFAQGEFLNWVNTLPEAILIEWIGPFLGAMRSMGTPSETNLAIRITPRNTPFFIPAGFTFTTSREGEEQLEFILIEDLTVPAGSSIALGKVECVVVGVEGNVPANTITKVNSNLSGLISVTNPEPARGGTDMESVDEVKERFFRQIRRRIPVSTDDWKDLVEDVLGPDVICNVVFNRSDRYYYNQSSTEDLHHFCIFALNSDGSALSSSQYSKLKKALDLSTPVGISGNIYPLNTEYVDVEVEVEYSTSNSTPRELATRVKESIQETLKPNGDFPSDYAPRVNDLEGNIRDRLDNELGGSGRYSGPDVTDLRCYISPAGIPRDTFGEPFNSSFRVSQGDLVVQEIAGSRKYYASQVNFNPVTFSKSYHINSRDLKLVPILPFESRPYGSGDIIGHEGSLYHVKSGFHGSGNPELDSLQLGDPIEPKDWLPGTLYNPFSGGEYHPNLFLVDQGEIAELLEPEGSGQLNLRPGWLVAVATQSFTSVRTTSSISSARSLFLISDNEVDVMDLAPEVYYNPGSYIRPPKGVYKTFTEGYITPSFRVVAGFKVTENEAESFYNLVNNGSIVRVREVFLETDDRDFLFKPRFKCGEYLRYRPSGGLIESREECLNSLSDECKILLSEGFSPPSFFLALRDFTPWTKDIGEMVSEGAILEVDFPYEYVPPSLSLLPEVGECQYTCQIPNPGPEEGSPDFRDLFHLSPGDVVSMFNGEESVSYVCKTHVTPVFPPEVYIDSGTMEEVSSDPNRNFYPSDPVEDLVRGYDGYYRVLRSFTPRIGGSLRSSENKGELLRVVVELSGSDKIITKGEKMTSVTNSGVVRVSLNSGETLDYQWEGDSLTEETGIKNVRNKVSYRGGTLSL